MQKKSTKKTPASEPGQMRLWLMYPPKLITNPVIWELAKKFPAQKIIQKNLGAFKRNANCG